MTKYYARLDAGKTTVQEVFAFPDALSLADAMPAEFAGGVVACGADVREFWTYDGSAFSAPPAPTISKASLLQRAAEDRYAKEVGGIKVSGFSVETDDRSKLMILGAFSAANANNSFTTPWVGADGSIVTLTAAQIIAIGNAVQTHVATCFTAYANLATQIGSGAVTTLAAVDAAFASLTTSY